MDEEIKKILQQNLELTKEIYRMTKKIKNYITWQKIVSIIYLLLIVVPIVLSFIFLPPLLKGVFDQYKDLLGSGTSESGSIQDAIKGSAGNINLNNIDPSQLPASVRKLLNK